MAPEVIENNFYGTEADIYAIGVMFYQCIFGEPPYEG